MKIYQYSLIEIDQGDKLEVTYDFMDQGPYFIFGILRLKLIVKT